MPDKTWKAAERKVARLLGGDRVGPTGKATPDVVTKSLAIEVKTRKTFPKWLLDAMEQSRVNAALSAEDRHPVVVLHKVGDRYEEATVCLDLKVFKEILEGRIE